MKGTMLQVIQTNAPSSWDIVTCEGPQQVYDLQNTVTDNTVVREGTAVDEFCLQSLYLGNVGLIRRQDRLSVVDLSIIPNEANQSIPRRRYRFISDKFAQSDPYPLILKRRLTAVTSNWAGKIPGPSRSSDRYFVTC